MPASKYSITGFVARIVTDEELIINKGFNDGVAQNMIFDILDPRTQHVTDPVTNEDLGSIDRVLATVRVTQVEPRLSMAHLTSSRATTFSSTAKVFGGITTTRLTSETWPEGVRMGDPVGHDGRSWTPPRPKSE